METERPKILKATPLVIQRRRAVNAIQEVANYYELANFFNRRLFDSEDHTRCFCVGPDEVRFTEVPGDLADRVIATVVLDEPAENLAMVVITDAVDLVRKERRAQFRPQDFGIPYRHPKSRAPEIVVTVPVLDVEETPKHPVRLRQKPQETKIWKPRVIGRLGVNNG